MAILKNIETLISFWAKAEDAKYLTQEFYPIFSQDHLVNLSAYNIYLKLMIDGTTSQPFSAGTLPIS
jgi:hypothetical protein